MSTPELHYAIAADDVRVAYHDYGEGPPLVFVPEVGGHIEGFWDGPSLRRVFERLATNLRVLMFDHRGTGLSDGQVELPTLDDRILDIAAVMDAAGVERAHLMGFAGGAQVGIGFAAAHPDRVDRLVIMNARVGASGRERAADLNPGVEEPLSESALESPEARARAVDKWGIEVRNVVTQYSPSFVNHPEELDGFVEFQRKVGGRDTVRRALESMAAIDIVPIAPKVQAPTQVGNTAGNRWVHVGYARLLAELIPNATLMEFEGEDDWFWLADNWREIVDSQIEFLTGTPVSTPVTRRFAVVLFTDIVDSTNTALTVGDAEWRRRLDQHDRGSRRVVERHEGSLVNTTGDGIVAIFESPSQAIDAAVSIQSEMDTTTPIRAGLHAGEIELRGEDISGAIVNLAARVTEAADRNSVYVTAALKDMLLGSAHSFAPTGTHHLKGFDDEWPLFRVEK